MKDVIELEKKLIKFLLTAAVYSENAIIKNLGIDKETLIFLFSDLEKKGYLESYEEFLKRESLNENSCCKNKMTHCCLNSNSSKNCCSGNIFSNVEDYSNIKILTEKAIDEFQK